MVRWFFIFVTALTLSASPLLADISTAPASPAQHHGMNVDHDAHASGESDCCGDCEGDCLEACMASAPMGMTAPSRFMTCVPALWGGATASQITPFRPESVDPPPRA